MWRIDFDSVSVAFTGRRGGVSGQPFDSLNLGPFTRDDPQAVVRNLELVRESLGLTDLHWCRQVHGGVLHDATANSAPGTVAADGIHTSRKREGVLVSVADCLPVALAGRDRVVMLHCGWRGLAAGLIARGTELFGNELPCAAIGPGIGQAAYAVGDEVVNALGEIGAAACDRGRLDLRAVAKAQLSAAGVERIESVDICTFSEPDQLYSHRRDGETGRQAGVAWLN